MNAAIVDWCTATFEFQKEQFPALLRAIGTATGFEVSAADPIRRNGFTEGYAVTTRINFQKVVLCFVCWGGEAMRGRAMIDVQGSSCGCIADWQMWRELLEDLPASRLTRVDLAVDLHDGAFGVDDAVEWVEAGDFNCNGRNPSTRVDGDWLASMQGGTSKAGRTLYVGKAKNGKALRVYEKGKQLGDETSEWNRFEVQFGNRDRVLPFAILTESDRFFVGAYPALERVLDEAGERIKTISDTASITIARILRYAKDSLGKWVHCLTDGGVPIDELVESITVRQMPNRLQPSVHAAGVLGRSVGAAFKSWRASQSIH